MGRGGIEGRMEGKEEGGRDGGEGELVQIQISERSTVKVL